MVAPSFSNQLGLLGSARATRRRTVKSHWRGKNRPARSPEGLQAHPTEWPRRDEALERWASESAVLDSALDAIVTSDQEGKILKFNPAAEKTFGYSRAEALGRSMAELLIAPAGREGYRRGLARYLATGERQARGQRVEVKGLRRDGSQFPAELTLTRVGSGSAAILAAFIRDVTERQWTEEKLKASREQLRALVQRLHNLQEDERARVARVLNEELSQLLAYVKIELSLTERQLGEIEKSAAVTSLSQKVDSVCRIIDQGMEEVRTIATQLRPSELDRPGLVAALEAFAHEVRSQTGLDCQLTLPRNKLPITPGLATALYRICQEAVANILRHAQATRLHISLTERARELVLEVRDNGRGISQAQVESPLALGILCMRERAQKFGGEVQVAGAPSSGTTVTVQIPLTRQGELSL